MVSIESRYQLLLDLGWWLVGHKCGTPPWAICYTNNTGRLGEHLGCFSSVEEVGWEQRHSWNTAFGVLKGLLYTKVANHVRAVTESPVKIGYACPCAWDGSRFWRSVAMMIWSFFPCAAWRNSSCALMTMKQCLVLQFAVSLWNYST